MKIPEYKIIDLSSYPRKDHLLYFEDMAFPYLAMNVNIDITAFMKELKKNNLPFFLSFLYVVINSLNAIPELKQRVKDNNIIEYNYCLSSHTVLKDDNTF